MGQWWVLHQAFYIIMCMVEVKNNLTLERNYIGSLTFSEDISGLFSQRRGHEKTYNLHHQTYSPRYFEFHTYLRSRYNSFYVVKLTHLISDSKPAMDLLEGVLSVISRDSEFTSILFEFLCTCALYLHLAVFF